MKYINRSEVPTLLLFDTKMVLWGDTGRETACVEMDGNVAMMGGRKTRDGHTHTPDNGKYHHHNCYYH
jgi:hypothetical protein